jgi:hypothetical protein
VPFMVESGLFWELPWIIACVDLRNSTPLVGFWHNDVQWMTI